LKLPFARKDLHTMRFVRLVVVAVGLMSAVGGVATAGVRRDAHKLAVDRRIRNFEIRHGEYAAAAFQQRIINHDRRVLRRDVIRRAERRGW
jgi:hypothetical protein